MYNWSTLKKLIWLYAAKLKGGAQAIIETITGTLPLVLQNALSHAILSLTRYGLCTQDGTPTPSAPVDILCNNGVLKARRQSGLPLGYQMVEWLKSAGAIPITDFKTKSTQEIETVFYRERSGASYLYSSDTATSGTTNTTAYLTSGAGNWRWDGKSYSIGVSTGIKFTSIQNKDGVWLNGTKTGWYSDAGEFVSTNDLRLSSSENTTVRIYSMTIREGETVTLDLVPVQRLSDSAYGFYDKVSGNFYTNADATFEVGPVIDDPVEIYTDGTPEVLTVSGINLLDPSTSNIKIGQQVTANGEITSLYPNNWRTDYIPVEGGKAYAFWGRTKSDNTISAYNRINWYTVDKTHIYPRPSYTVDTVTVATAPSNAAYAILSCSPYKSDAAITRETFDLFNWMFVESSAEVPYQPYITPQTVSVPMLLGVGDYKDAAELISGIKTGKVAVAVLDGTETDWAKLVSAARVMFYRDSNLPEAKNVSTEIGAIECTIATHGGNSWVSTADIIVQRSSKNFGFMNPTGFTTDSTVDEWKAYLAAQYTAGTPIIIIYPLATETTEQTTAQHLVTNEGTNIVDSVANVGPVEAEVEYYASA